MKSVREKLNDRVRRLSDEGKSPEEIADLLIAEKKVERRRALWRCAVPN